MILPVRQKVAPNALPKLLIRWFPSPQPRLTSPKSAHAIVAIPDPKKGEQLILMTTSQTLKRPDISAYFKENQITELSVPKEIIVVEKLPLLGTGKVDYVEVKNLVTLSK